MISKNKFLDLKNYELLYPIGAGNFSKVYRVKNRTNNKYYAAKVSLSMVNEDTKDSKETLLLFREVNLMSLLNHPAILKFIGYSQTDFEGDSMPTIITEFATNGSLRSIIQLESQGLSPKEWDATMKLINIYGIASGMSYMHEHKVLHRDLKPENILVDDFLHPKIADFGLSKITDTLSISMNIQSQNGLKGTPIYMAPEVVIDEKYSTAGDVYAFGYIVFELLTGILPFEGFSIQQIIKKVVNGGYRPTIDDDVPIAFKDLIEKCWSQLPEDRPSFSSIVEDLKNPEFITELVDESKFWDYVDFIENSQATFDISNRLAHFEEFVKVHGRNKTAIKVVLNKNDDDNEIDSSSSNNSTEELPKESLSVSEETNIIKTQEKPRSVQEESNLKQINIQSDVRNVEIKQMKIKEENNSKVEEKNPMKIEEENTSKVEEENFSKIEEENNSKVEEKNPMKVEEESTSKVEEETPMKVEEKYNLIYPINEFNKLNEQCKILVEEAQNDPEKQYLVGKYLIEGENEFPESIRYGLQYMNQSVANKCQNSIIYYCFILIKGKIVPRDIGKAKEYLQEIKPNEHIYIILSGMISMKEKKYNKAKSFFKQGVDFGDLSCMYKYAKLIFINDSKSNIKEAFKYFELSKNKGYEKSKQFLAIYKKMCSIKKFLELPVETQYLLISKTMKATKISNDPKSKFVYTNITIQPQKTEMLFFNNSLKSSVFYSCLMQFQNIYFELDYPSEQFEIIHDFVSKLKKRKLKQLEVVIVVSSFSQLSSFCNSKNLKFCRISSSIQDINYRAFGDCSTLEEITIPPSVIDIGSYSFRGCSSLKKLEIPTSVRSIGDFALVDCSSLMELSIPSSVTSIGKELLKGCCSLLQVTIQLQISEINDHFYEGCSSLKQITIPPSVTKIERAAFKGCSSLKQITIPSSVIFIGEAAFEGCSSVKQITIPSSVTEIERDAFKGCSSLTQITIHSSVTKIGGCAFEGCSSLTQISISSSVTEIERDAFKGCSSLTQISIPSSVTEIGVCAFEGCSSLTQITIPSSVTKIGGGAFKGCSSLTQISIPTSVTEIGCHAFDGCSSLKQISIPSSVSEIGEAAFGGCSSLTQITIPSSVAKIGWTTFEGCSSLKQISIPSSVTKIEWGAFERCSSLTQISIPSSVTKIECGAFEGCSSLTQITIPSSLDIKYVSIPRKTKVIRY